MGAAPGGRARGPDTAEGRASERERRSAETPHTETQRPKKKKKKKKKWSVIPENCGIITQRVTAAHLQGPPEDERENAEISEATTVENFPKVPRSRKLRKY